MFPILIFVFLMNFNFRGKWLNSTSMCSWVNDNNLLYLKAQLTKHNLETQKTSPYKFRQPEY